MRQSLAKATINRDQGKWAKTAGRLGQSRKGGVGATEKTIVYCFTRGGAPGSSSSAARRPNFCRSWARVQLHSGVTASIWAQTDSIYLTDDGGHLCANVRSTAQVLIELAFPDKPAALSKRARRKPFQPVHPYGPLSPNGRKIYVSDGTANATFTNTRPTANYCCRGASPGSDPGQFQPSVHNICTDADGWVYGPTVSDPPGPGIHGTASTRPNGHPTGRAVYMDYIRHPAAISANFG